MHLRCNDHYCKTDASRSIEDPILTRALFGPNWKAGRTTGSSLRVPWWVNPSQDSRRGVRRHLDWFVAPGTLNCAHCEKPTDYRLCPRCHAHLPDSVVTLDMGHVAIFGPQSVGKTTFVTVLLHELDNHVGPEEGFILDPLTEEIRERYDREYHETTYGGSQFGIGEEIGGEVYRRSHSATAPIEANRSILQPLVYKITNHGKRGSSQTSLLSFFDTAGEDWDKNIDLLRAEARYLKLAKGLLFLVDPLRIRAVAWDGRIRLTEKESRVPAADYLSDVRKLSTFFPRTPVETPLAICLNKLDRWGGLMEPGSRLYDLARSVVPGRPDKNLDRQVHEEVQRALRGWGAASFLEHVAVTFPNHQFFACSALGDAAQEHDDQAQPLPTPLLIDRPVLWLLRQQGVLTADSTA